ncbi:MAG: sigma-54-dependent Fis family transcriptional regulator [Ignavibacteriae bacterium]|nr:sigma-54-dependent Fis family transcriptional regulator [Ignavibacteriota bacterium]
MNTTDDQNILHLLQLRYGIVASSAVMIAPIQRLVQVAPTDLTTLITGETGTGKEVFAHAIHGLSKRRKHPFVSVNCGAIPETLLESELFGHEKGAFTGAIEQRKGFFESADKGTILLDEIGEMPISTQVKLLRVLESGEFTRVGSPEMKHVDVRVIAATNRDLLYEVRQGNFREDLFFRLNSVQIVLPPLRKHPEDIGLLVEYFASKVCTKNDIEFEGISDEALIILENMPWRGNVRELRNFVETLVTLENGQYITPELLRKYIPPALPSYEEETYNSKRAIIHVAEPIRREEHNESDIVMRSLLEVRNEIADIKRGISAIIDQIVELRSEKFEVPVIVSKSLEKTDKVLSEDEYNLEEMERKLIVSALTRYEGNRRLAAKTLGISERTLYRKLIDYKLTELV